MSTNIKPGDWIKVGNTYAVVCQLYKDNPAYKDNPVFKDQSNRIEVVYLDGSRAINEDVHRVGNSWEFVIQGPSGGYADKYSRLSEFVSILRTGYNPRTDKTHD